MNRPLPPSRTCENAKKLQNARTLYAQRAGVEGTVAQAVRTCEMRRARNIGSKKLRLQAFFTATALNMLRAGACLANGTHALNSCLALCSADGLGKIRSGGLADSNTPTLS
jgi:hypothetical protein